MRVLQAMAGGDQGGAETFFVALVTALARAGLEQRALIRTHPGRALALGVAGIPTGQVRFGGPLDLASRLAFRRTVRRWRPDIVLTWMSRATAACPRGPYRHIARIGGPYDPKYYRRADHLVVISQGLRDWYVAAGWPAHRIHHIPNFATVGAAAPAERATMATPADAPLLLALGRLHPNKAFDVLIEALPSVPEAHLWIAGDGPLRGELAALAERRGLAHRVRFLGWRADTAALFAAADAVVYPSRREPFGTVTLEAWAHGRPLVAAAAAGPAELITDERDGLLVPVDDPIALAAAIRRVLGDRGLRANLVAAGRARHAALYTEAAVVERYLSLFHALAG